MNSKINNTLKVLVTLALFSGSLITTAQIVHPDPGEVFDDSNVPVIQLVIPQTSLDSLYADPESNHEYAADFSFITSGLSQGPLRVEIRFRGDTIRHKQKKSFRISFNVDGGIGKFYGLEKLNLNAEINDPSLLRSKLGFTLMREIGLAAPRSNHVRLYINGSYYGVYLNTEQVDENFLKSRFDTNDGNMFRCRDLADLSYIGPHSDYYKFEVDGRRSYALRTNEKWDDYNDLALMINILENNDGALLKSELEEVFNLQQFLKAMAVEVMMGNWDSYSVSSTNYYLYRDQSTGRFEFIPYNLENTLGIDFAGGDWTSRSIYDFQEGNRPLVEKLMAIDEVKHQYTAYIKSIAAYMQDDMGAELSRWQAQLAPFVSADTYYPLDWGFSFMNFTNALIQPWGDHVTYGLQSFVDLRLASALSECVNADAFPLFSHVRIVPGDKSIGLDWTVEDDAAIQSSTLHYRVDGGEWQSRAATGTAHSDMLSMAVSYTDSIEAGAESTMDVYLTTVDAGGQESRFPAEWLSFSYPLVNGPLFINEFMASNLRTIADEFGEYDDWVEIYNGSDEQVWMSDFYLSDENGDPGKYRFPNKFLDSGAFYLVWLDSDTEQGENHATFKITRTGERIRLSGSASTGFPLVDSLSYGEQQTDISFGRVGDGGPSWIYFSDPTPEASNLLSGLDNPGSIDQLILFPNPVRDSWFSLSRPASGSLYSITGQKALEFSNTDRVDVSRLKSGLYILRTLNGESLRVVISH